MLSLPLMIGAFVAGLLMFLAPCTLPIVPGYLAFIAGSRKQVLRNALGFVIGFSILFILLGGAAGLFGVIIGSWRFMLGRIGGVIIILFGLTMLGVFNIPLLTRERHMKLPAFITVGNPISSTVLGALFALGWSPCIGPILGTILFIASASATALSGALLLGIFSLGLAVPFLLTALVVSRAQKFFDKAGKVSQALSIIGGVFLVLLGVLMLFNLAGLLVGWGNGALHFIGYDRLLNYL
jgi:cytochrome c-type biogenesis protein